MGESELADKTLVFDRTPIARLISCAAAFGSAAFLFDYLARGAGNIRPLPLLGLVLLVIGTIAAALLQYGDHIYLSPDGLLYENRWLQFIGRSGSWLRWDEVVEVREVRRKILILLSGDGRRILVDAVTGYAIARKEILKRAPHAVISGTLTKEDRP
ncbi:MAG TPA: hypothetical protein VNM92_17105 [Thermoanaerobaculia bacterium]|nr:hypothetical protein [Thermoanaerobaculia bacterium]